MLSIRIENKLKYTFNSILSKLRSFVLFGSYNKVRFGRRVHLSGSFTLGKNVSILENSKIRGKQIEIGDSVFIHENVFIRSADLIQIGKGTSINRNTCILDKVTIGAYCSVGPNCVIVGSNHVFKEKSKRIKEQGITSIGILIEEDVWLGANVTVLDDVKIGKGAVVAAGAVVNDDIPSFAVVGGVPAKVISYRN